MSRSTSNRHDAFSSASQTLADYREHSAPDPGSRRDPFAYPLQALSVGVFFGGGLLLTFLWPLVRWSLGEAHCAKYGSLVLQRLFRLFSAVLQRLGLFRVNWPDAHVLAGLRGTVVVANHPGLLDAVFLLSELPSAVCVMQASLTRNPAFSGAAQLAGYIRNDQGAEMIRECVRKLQAGDNLLIFPEGTRTRHPEGVINRFKGGFALAAVCGGAEVQTVFIEQSRSYLTHGMRVLEPVPVPVVLNIKLGEAFFPTSGESARDFAERVEGYYIRTLSAPVQSGKGVS
jgi:1-acyl-sn-glycerol-3-phosphate acyltransferase